MITFHGFGRVHRAVLGETRDLRVQWALEELGLPYRMKQLDHTGGELDGEAFGEISCFRQLPILEDDGFVLSESAAILLYLAEKAGKLIPADVQGRARVTQWCFAALATVELPLADLLMVDKFGDGAAKARRPGLVQYANRHLKNLERRLEGRDWIACADFTVADILMASVLREIRHTDLLAPYPNLAAYYARAMARPAWRRTLATYAERHGVAVEEIA